MNKKELVNKLAKQTGLTQAKAMEVVNALFEAENGKGILTLELESGRKVTIPGFGTFGTKVRAARVGVNPTTKDRIQIAPKKYAFFRPGKNLRELVEA
ncbi:MAG: HU family DNA-binding protein [Deltaproteobacteria bacterium]|jgi:DNA-binding protein HU-beta|nr:HU family DNA-binding protein [Deltaproteobacteria bacterium]MBK9367373.1 HU family DNA-binding protein [Deltaproteobacteria bacterium]MBK9644609.1 HU family DNA-binding protein [Deltaproteobacteria bacterium]MCK6517988.1 HU family DNA-binding protein [Myxococcota bacterium]MCK6524937.1 HU family DNA-binding protein [Myxococcota bacterium]